MINTELALADLDSVDRALQRAQCRSSPRELIDETKRPPQSLERARHHARLVPVAPG